MLAVSTMSARGTLRALCFTHARAHLASRRPTLIIQTALSIVRRMLTVEQTLFAT